MYGPNLASKNARPMTDIGSHQQTACVIPDRASGVFERTEAVSVRLQNLLSSMQDTHDTLNSRVGRLIGYEPQPGSPQPHESAPTNALDAIEILTTRLEECAGSIRTEVQRL